MQARFLGLEDIELVGPYLRQPGRVAALGTETVYGLAGSAMDPVAIERIFALKQRPPTNPLIVHLASYLVELAQLFELGLIDLTRLSRAQIQLYNRLVAHWPVGPLTILLPRGPQVPLAVSGGQDLIALRRPAPSAMATVLKGFAGGLVAPSANPYQRLSPTTAQAVLADFGHEDLWILDSGPTPLGIESSLISLLDVPEKRAAIIGLHRLGALGESSLAEVGRCEVQRISSKIQSLPGGGRRHYAPRVPLHLLSVSALQAFAQPGADRFLQFLLGSNVSQSNRLDLGASLGIVSFIPAGFSHQDLESAWGGSIFWQTLPSDAGLAAPLLYETLRSFELIPGLSRIVVLPPPGADELSSAVLDRLQRAAVPAEV